MLSLDAGHVVELPQIAWQSGVLTGTHDNGTADPSDDAAVSGSVVTSEGADCASAMGATSSDAIIGAVLA